MDPRHSLTAAALRADVDSAADEWYEAHPSFPGLRRPRCTEGSASQQSPVWCMFSGAIASEACTSQRDGYTSAVDSWALGVILYVLLTCQMPYYPDLRRPQLVLQNLMRFLDIVNPPWNGISVTAKDLLVRLLDPSPITRLSAADALKHPWFKGTSATIPEAAIHPWLHAVLEHQGTATTKAPSDSA